MEAMMDLCHGLNEQATGKIDANDGRESESIMKLLDDIHPDEATKVYIIQRFYC